MLVLLQNVGNTEMFGSVIFSEKTHDNAKNRVNVPASSLPFLLPPPPLLLLLLLLLLLGPAGTPPIALQPSRPFVL
jgi:hypothetical protein